ncbi:hypothetical protein [Agrococcus beijingensis]|uniref:hypothetical protein n=1 Tax=Agrococcus beijingensis TaxID=3068634 RepID=UPI00274202AA|nr:hypothetical protein [Agrococcus sp. REN33]
MRTIATVLAGVSLICVGLVLFGAAGVERSIVAAITCAILAVAFAVLSLRSPAAEADPVRAPVEGERTA